MKTSPQPYRAGHFLHSIRAQAAVDSHSPRRILLLLGTDGLSQRAFIALREQGHAVEVAVVDSAAAMERRSVSTIQS